MQRTDWNPFREDKDDPGFAAARVPPERAVNPAFAPWLFPGVRWTPEQEAEARRISGDEAFERGKRLGLEVEALRVLK